MIKSLRPLRVVIGVLAGLVLTAGVASVVALMGSLPPIDGQHRLRGLGAAVTLERDTLGVVSVRGQSRSDVARATGFAHAQDRFFQMDLLRRRPAAELADLLGGAAAPLDRHIARHELRSVAERVAARLPADELALLTAYADGVNEGLASLRVRPWEYLVLQVQPRPWTPVDSLLVSLAIAVDLLDEDGRYELNLATVQDVLGAEAFAFFAPLIGPEDAALDDSVATLPQIPGPEVLNVRAGDSPTTTLQGAPPLHAGSNAFAVAGPRGPGAAALLAGDMHLGLSVPNTWYRTRLQWAGNDVIGVTLPGLPFTVIGSNGRIAWSFTNSFADVGDLVVVETDPNDPQRYRDGASWRHFERREYQIAVRGAAPQQAESTWTVWGPVVARDTEQRPLAQRWTLHDPEAVDTGIRALETAASVDAALAAGRAAGGAPLNLMVAGADGSLAWTLTGRLPARLGFDGRRPRVWEHGAVGWNGFLPSERKPSLVADEGGVLWSTNQRMLGGDALGLIGDGGYESVGRGRQVRDRLRALQELPVSEADLLDIQLDDHAPWLDRWQRLMLAILGDEDDDLRSVLEAWNGRASVASAGYRLVREWRDAVAQRVMLPIFAACRAAEPAFDYRWLPREAPLWAVLQQRPLHLLDAQYADWDALLRAALGDLRRGLSEAGLEPADATWGKRNRASIRHPLSAALPGFIAAWIDMPSDALPGDTALPRVQGPSFGASQRMVVAPGHERRGLFHMPGGQSGHPLSSFYRAGHEDWVAGRPSPLLPGAPVAVLHLQPLPARAD